MAIKEKLEAAFKIIVALSGLILTFYTVVELTVFLSNPTRDKVKKITGDFWISASWSLVIDQLLLSNFILLHSILAKPEVKEWIAIRLKTRILLRSFYIILTSSSLQIMLKYWHHIPGVTLWSINTNVKLYWWSFMTLHAFVWALIYVGMICMDVNELLGIKQVYYDVRRLPDPNLYKSSELKRLYAHTRHPSFICFLIILWAVPYMTLDKLLLAVIWSIYMYLTWNTTRSDYRYQQDQFVKKIHEFNYLK